MIGVRIGGIPELKAELAALVPKLRVRALRNALAAGARVVQRAARGATPVISASAVEVRRGYRKPGTVQKAISVRTSKIARRQGDVGVFVNVRPAKRGLRGGRNPNDPFYWRWLNFGWNPARSSDGGGAKGVRFRRQLNRSQADKRRPGARFLEAGAARLQQALQVFIQRIGPAINRLNKPKAPAP